jgi:hypothetical protein
LCAQQSHLFLERGDTSLPRGDCSLVLFGARPFALDRAVCQCVVRSTRLRRIVPRLRNVSRQSVVRSTRLRRIVPRLRNISHRSLVLFGTCPFALDRAVRHCVVLSTRLHNVSRQSVVRSTRLRRIVPRLRDVSRKACDLDL